MSKCPGARPIGVGEMLRRILCKVFLLVAGEEAARACSTDQLHRGLEVGMEGAAHHMRNTRDINLNEEDSWGVLLIENRKMMLRAAKHKWPSGSHFLFNMCWHHSVLVLRGKRAKDAVFLHSEEGVTEGCPLSIVAHALLISQLIKQLKKETPVANSMQFVDDGSVANKFNDIESFF